MGLISQALAQSSTAAAESEGFTVSATLVLFGVTLLVTIALFAWASYKTRDDD